MGDTEIWGIFDFLNQSRANMLIDIDKPRPHSVISFSFCTCIPKFGTIGVSSMDFYGR